MFNLSAKNWLSRLSRGLKKTRQHIGGGLATLILGKKTIDEDLLKTLKTHLLKADVGVQTTEKILNQLTDAVSRQQLRDPAVLLDTLKQILTDVLTPHSQPLPVDASPFVILMVGINGAGKTTSIAKLAHYYQQLGKKILLAAGDTFRAAAIEQLQTWGARNNVPVVAQQTGSDSASVVYDALQSALAKKTDIVIADTAGRLHTQSHLMDELKKVKRVMGKLDANAPHEVMLVIDASLGQNSLIQAKQFHDAIGVTGLTITKLDGTAKGGVLFAIADQLQLPIRFIGIGEQMDDLKPFDAKEFIDALFATDA